ncbi:unnamed protein product [Effrenium voratum]|uniref:Uncharacterized protein n=1 Tax=Effrenium voratum TaxID=2562239 RepID=A0AA36JD56_9DINO|nr:unnamed protein product [Effrenium voratum]
MVPAENGQAPRWAWGAALVLVAGSGLLSLVAWLRKGEKRPERPLLSSPLMPVVLPPKSPAEPDSEELRKAVPELLAAVQHLPKSQEDVPPLAELLQKTQASYQDHGWLQRRDEPALDLARWLEARDLRELVQLSSRRAVLMEKLEELHDLKWDAPFDAEEEAIKENKIARDAAGME